MNPTLLVLFKICSDLTNALLIHSSSRDSLKARMKMARGEEFTEEEFERLMAHRTFLDSSWAQGIERYRRTRFDLFEQISNPIKFSVGNCLESATLCAFLLFIVSKADPWLVLKNISISLGNLVPGDHGFCMFNFEGTTYIIDPWSEIVEANGSISKGIFLRLPDYIDYVRSHPNGYFEANSEIIELLNFNGISREDLRASFKLLEDYNIFEMLRVKMAQTAPPRFFILEHVKRSIFS